jgi:glycerol uptake facilitator-like aquaporin
VSLGLLVARRLPASDLVAYVVAQVLGAIGAALVIAAGGAYVGLFGEGVESAVSPVGVRPAAPRARCA